MLFYYRSITSIESLVACLRFHVDASDITSPTHIVMENSLIFEVIPGS